MTARVTFPKPSADEQAERRYQTRYSDALELALRYRGLTTLDTLPDTEADAIRYEAARLARQ